MQDLKIDIGCGGAKKEGFLGIDYVAFPGVDYSVDLNSAGLPFPDQSVSHIFTSHFLEHVTNVRWDGLFKEMTRVAQDKAQIEIWNPYVFTNAAFISGHLSQLNEDQYLHMGVYFPAQWSKALGAFWTIKEFQYVVSEQTLIDLSENNISLSHALRYYKEVVREFGVFIEVCRGEYQPVTPIKTFSIESRDGEKHLLKQEVYADNKKANLLQKAVGQFSEKKL
ncbi:hypothetical protein [Candidatus Albibeggiatoa sp. nov. BB20]|uniref:class I SAM-dependent methyltransferase n=1 Tax=Candidatus Albibeggiatoa sp. nov. BB20 TaxID=3162723 RepID=UPI003365353E